MFLIISLLLLAIVWIGAFRIMKRYLFEKNKSNKRLKEQNEEYIALNKELQTAKKHAEESEKKLKFEKEIIEKILDTQLDTVFVFNPINGKAKRWNKKFEELTGYSALEISEMKAPDSYYSSEELIKANTYLENIIKEGFGIVELQLICKNGKIIPTEYAVSVIYDEQGTPVDFISIGRDITERKQVEQVLKESESRYRGIFHENKSIMLLIEPETGRLIDANKSALAYYGYSKTELLSLNITNINILPKAQLEQEMQKALIEKKHYFEFKHKLANGEIRDVQVYSGKVEINKESFLYSIVHDITAQRIAENALKEREKQLLQLNATKDKLFSIIAHDLRSPFSSILGFSNLLIENIKNYEVAKSEKYLELINSSAKNTLILLDNLLNWAKTQTGNIIIESEKMILSALIQEVIEISNAAAKIKNIALNYNQSDDIEIYADKDLLKTILRNLISNAIKFTNPGGDINVFVILKQNQVEISISDNGVGIKDEIRKKLFDVSTNITSYGTAKEKGSGLGLVLCKEFIEKLGGNILITYRNPKSRV